MTYAASGLIYANDFNTIAWNNPSIGGQWGVGYGIHGLGQDISEILPANPTDTISLKKWNKLLETIDLCFGHQGTAPLKPISINSPNLITYFQEITSNSQNVYRETGITGLPTVDSLPTKATFEGNWGTSGLHGIKFTHTVTFASADMARYFFNAGGKIKLTFSRAGGTTTVRNTDWTTLASNCGIIEFGFTDTKQFNGTGTPSTLLNSNNGGYWKATTTPTVNFQQYDAGISGNQDYISTTVALGGTLANGGYSTIIFETIWMNDHADAFQPGVDGTTITNLIVAEPNLTYIENSWGIPVVTAMAVSMGGTNFEFNQTISSNTENFDFRAAAIAGGWDQIKPIDLNIIVASGVYVGSANVALPAMDTGNTYPTGSSLSLNNLGTILGVGGDGGNGGAWSLWSSFSLETGQTQTPGSNGGPALKAQTPILVNNLGIIGGGGGGGGGGGYAADNHYFEHYWAAAGGGGGGGAGYRSGVHGNSWSAGHIRPGGDGTDASFLVPGTGGPGVYNAEGTCISGAGAKGGLLGTNGSVGFAGSAGTGSNQGGALGGTPGLCIDGIANVAWAKEGTTYGPRA